LQRAYENTISNTQVITTLMLLLHTLYAANIWYRYSATGYSNGCRDRFTAATIAATVGVTISTR